MRENFELVSSDELTKILKKSNISSWNELTDFIKNLPYGRNDNRTDLSLVLKDKKGTCSSKHALLKEIASLNAIPNIKLILGIYKMNSSNTPKIGDILVKVNLQYIPEAHCYLFIDGERIDFTSRNSDFNRIKNDVLLEQEIEPHQVAQFKVDFHKAFIKTWIKEQNIPFSFNEIWELREQCITNLSA
ncbi:hypothetical protein [Winogradskyella sp.]|uniref:hypothetical protein n=1 Tax=Winogradskyella sp. TaxID=1883156 RepID=UPI0025D48BB5|nr:hypothetical protein [Winogradskyella sp.]